MLILPKSTEFNKRIPKQKFYDNLSVTPSIKGFFTEQIKAIYWRNKIASTTMNLAPGVKVNELEVFEVHLNTNTLHESVLKLIDKEIPYHILFLLKYEDKYQAWIGYKEASSGNSAFKVDSYYHTDWLEETDLILKPEGLDLDAVYESFVRQIAGDKLQNNVDLKTSVEISKRKERLKKEIAALEKKINREKQFNKQVEISTNLKRLKKELNSL